MMLKRERALAVMVDLQERLVPAMAQKEQLVSDCELLMRGLHVLDVPVLATQQYTRGLGDTIPELKPYLEEETVEKITFSCWKEPSFREKLQAMKRNQIIVFGAETHICVQQTVLDLLENDFEVFLMTDCVASRFERDKTTGLRRMETAGAVLTSMEAALFELCEQGGTETFKEISKIAKSRT